MHPSGTANPGSEPARRSPAQTPLCEDCGYDIQGLSGDGTKCPECGRAVASSLPTSRVGTPWQTAPTFRAWLETNLGMLRSPTRMFERLRMSKDGAGWLLFFNLLVASIILVSPWTGVLAADPVRRGFSRGVAEGITTALWVVPSQIAALIAVMLLLTWIEFLGVRFIAGRRGWRLTQRAAWLVCCHASAGWIVLALMPFAALVVQFVLVVRPLFSAPPALTAWLGRVWGVTINDVVMVATPAAGFIVGIFIFELLVYKGVRACRFAADLPDNDVTR